MTGISRDDLRAAVASGTLSEAQAASLVVLSEQRSGVRAHLDGRDEPFELFKGFNEIFIVVGLVILYMGFAGVTGMTILGTTSGYILGMVYAVLGMGAVILLARYFTLTRRMVAPSIALSVMFGLLAGQFGMAFSAMLDLNTPQTLTCAAAIACVALSGYYALFRVPFTVALIAAAVYATVFGITTLGGSFPETPRDIFLLSADGPFAIVTMALGLIGLIVAMSFDMSDPHRVTRRAASGFWLHVIAAPAIVNTIALTLFDAGHHPRADHAGGLRCAYGRRGGGDRPAVLSRLGRGLRGGACRRSGRGAGILRDPHAGRGPRPAGCSMGVAAPRHHARPADLPGQDPASPLTICCKRKRQLDRPDPPRDRLGTRPVHHRPEGRQARRGRGAQEPLAAQAAGRRPARGGLSEEHPDGSAPPAVGKTEISRRLAKLARAPFIKV